MKLSPTMQEAVDKARAGDRKLHRQPGGFWCAGATESGKWPHCGWCTSAHTINALLRRGAAIETGWKNSGGGTFCVQVTIQ